MSSQPLHYLGICILNTAKITTKAILIQLFPRLAIPETAGIRTNLIGEYDTSVRKPTELQFEINKRYAALTPKRLSQS